MTDVEWRERERQGWAAFGLQDWTIKPRIVDNIAHVVRWFPRRDYHAVFDWLDVLQQRLFYVLGLGMTRQTPVTGYEGGSIAEGIPRSTGIRFGSVPMLHTAEDVIADLAAATPPPAILDVRCGMLPCHSPHGGGVSGECVCLHWVTVERMSDLPLDWQHRHIDGYIYAVCPQHVTHERASSISGVTW